MQREQKTRKRQPKTIQQGNDNKVNHLSCLKSYRITEVESGCATLVRCTKIFDIFIALIDLILSINTPSRFTFLIYCNRFLHHFLLRQKLNFFLLKYKVHILYRTSPMPQVQLGDHSQQMPINTYQRNLLAALA